MATMKGNKGKEAIGEESRPEAQSRARPLAGLKGNPYQRILIWEAFPVDEIKQLSVGRPK